MRCQGGISPLLHCFVIGLLFATSHCYVQKPFGFVLFLLCLAPVGNKEITLNDHSMSYNPGIYELFTLTTLMKEIWITEVKKDLPTHIFAHSKKQP